jgi:predicted dehydrogenase
MTSEKEILMIIGTVGNGGIVKTALSSLSGTGIRCTALWCRNGAKGKPLTEQFGIENLYTDYDLFLQDPSFDTVYVGLINSLHYEFTKKAILAGKNVICEKPLTGTLAEAEELVRTAKEKGVFLFEAIMLRYSRNYEAVKAHLDEIGDVKLVISNYSQYSSRFDDYQAGKVLPAFDPELYGGALYDINVYNIHTMTGLFGRPQNAVYYPNRGFNGADTSGVMVLDYGSFKAVCTGAKDSASDCFTMIQGTKGYIKMPGRPGVVRNVTLHLYSGEEKPLDAAQEDNPMANEFMRIADVLDRNDTQTAEEWMERSLETMEILETGRKA